MKSFDDLISEAESWNPEGWDFSSLNESWTESPPPWDYRGRISIRVPQIESLLDVGTGGGEFLSSLSPLPKHTYATEGYPPNVRVSKKRLEPLGAQVVQTYSEDNHKVPQLGSLPFRSDSFEMVINRHESFLASEVFRVLRPSGVFATEQVGSLNNVELNELLHAEKPRYADWNLEVALRQLTEVGFEIAAKQEASLISWFADIGAVVCYLKAVPWQIPDFSVEGYRNRLEELCSLMHKNGGLKVKAARFYVEAVKMR